MTYEVPDMAAYEGEMRWAQGEAREHCAHVEEKCLGPQIANVAFGPDGGGCRFAATCNVLCHAKIAAALPGVILSDPHPAVAQRFVEEAQEADRLREAQQANIA